MNIEQIYSRYGGFWVYPDLLDFCYLVNPYFSESKIIDEMQDNFRILVSEYPAGISVNSKLASDCWKVKQEYVIPGNGAAELIKILFENLDSKVGIVRPTFEEYPNRLSESNLEVYIPQNEDFRYNADDLINFFSTRPIESLLLINPDNPTGNFIPISEVHKLASWCKNKKIRFILDESFVDFSTDFLNNTFIDDSILEAYPRMCVIKSISKSYGVPGLRLGILCSADTKLIAKMKKQVSIWNINSFAEFFMQIYPRYREDYVVACQRFIQTRDIFEQKLKTIPYLRVMSSQANYFFVEVLSPFQPKELCSILLEKYNILASACVAKKGIESNRYMRIAVRNESDNEKLISSLQELISSNLCHI